MRRNNQTTFSETRLSREELRELVDQAAETGSVLPAAGKIASRAFDFAGLTASQVMVPRSHVVGIPRNASNEEIQRIALQHGYSRVPGYGESLDDVIGYVMVKDMLALAWEGRLFVLEDLLRPPYFVVESMPGAGSTPAAEETLRRKPQAQQGQVATPPQPD